MERYGKSRSIKSVMHHKRKCQAACPAASTVQRLPDAFPMQAERISDIRRKSIFLSMEVFVATFSSGCASNRYV